MEPSSNPIPEGLYDWARLRGIQPVKVLARYESNQKNVYFLKVRFTDRVRIMGIEVIKGYETCWEY